MAGMMLSAASRKPARQRPSCGCSRSSIGHAKNRALDLRDRLAEQGHQPVAQLLGDVAIDLLYRRERLLLGVFALIML
jgi:hypothetical protein